MKHSNRYKIAALISNTCICLLLLLTSCGVYKFKDSVIPADVKTVKIDYITNKATYVNPQAAQKLTDKLQQKIIGGTRLTRTNADNADYVISGAITVYDATQTVGISAQQANTNRLTVTVHVIWNDNVKTELHEFDVSRSFDYAASLSLQQAEGQLLDEVVRTLTDDIYNRIFSNW
jgi:hypothetical protein